MKRLMAGVLIGLAALGTAQAQSCQLGPGQRIEVLRHHNQGDMASFGMRLNGGPLQAVFTGGPDDSQGSGLTVRCLGTSRARALVLQGAFMGSAYPKGFVIAWNPFDKALQRIDFAERSAPVLLLLSARRMAVALPNVSNEVRGRYVVYRQSRGQTEPVIEGADQLPSSARSLRIRIH